MARIIINGKTEDIALPVSVSELIKIKNVLQPEMVSVQLNENFLDRDVWPATFLKEGDSLDFLYFMGGGAC